MKNNTICPEGIGGSCGPVRQVHNKCMIRISGGHVLKKLDIAVRTLRTEHFTKHENLGRHVLKKMDIAVRTLRTEHFTKHENLGPISWHNCVSDCHGKQVGESSYNHLLEMDQVN